MSTPAAAKPTSPEGANQFRADRKTNGKITLIEMRGVVAHDFDAKKLAAGINTKKVVIDMREVRRFASWGMAEWMDFLRANEQRDVYIVECSTYATSQLNLITGLLGHAKFISFFASYRCGTCNRELEMRFVIPNEGDDIRVLPQSDQVCPHCQGTARLEEYPAAFFDTIAERPPAEIDEEVLTYFNNELKYDIKPDRSRFRAFRRTKDGTTYLRVSGSLTGLPAETLINASQGLTVVDLEGAIADGADFSGWRRYVEGVGEKVPQLHLLNCPPRFLEQAVQISDLHHKMKIRTFATLYECARCNIVTPHYIDVADNLEQLATGVVPLRQCASCHQMLMPALASPAQLTLIRALPARDRDRNLDKFIEKARSEPNDRLQNALLLSPKDNKPKGSRAPMIAMALGSATLVGIAVIGYMVYADRKEHDKIVTQTTVVAPTPPPPPENKRPEWVVSDVPSSGFCQDMINRLMCVGVSAYRPTLDEATVDANDAVLDEIVNTIGLKITDDFFRDNIMTSFTAARNKGLTTLQAIDVDRKSDAFKKADTEVTAARRRVVDILQASGGPSVPSQRADLHWEKYNADGGGFEYLVFVRYDVTMDAVKNLVEKYSTTTKVAGSSLMTAFPSLAWQFPEFKGGALVVTPSPALKSLGIEKFDVISGTNDQRVGDVPTFSRRLDEWQPAKGPLNLAVTAPEKPSFTAALKRK